MSFDSFHFWAFYLVILGLVALLRTKVTARNAVLLVASYYFYGCWDWRFLSLIVISTVVDYSCGLALGRERPDDDTCPSTRRRRKLILLASLVTNLGLLGVFKYYNFFVDSAASLLTGLGMDPHPRTLNIVLPVGISFYTFQTLSYTIDLYRRKIGTEHNLLTFALYVAFFPQLVAGPIERARNLLPQMRTVRPVTWADLSSGAYLMFWGMFKKVVIADNVSAVADLAFGDPGTSGLFSLLGIYAFAVQIYCDFSGYSDIARGAARCMGFDLMLNFNLPYFATNPSEFWQRWHISLSSWLRDYLYIALGGNRVGKLRNYFNLMATMVLGGLWHGAAWVFILWGFYQGSLLCLHRLAEPLIQRITPVAASRWSGIWHVISVAFFFQLTCLGWLIFRADNVAEVGTMLTTIFTRFPGPVPGWANFGHLLTLALTTGVLFLVQLAQYRSRDLNIVFRLPAPLRAGFYAAVFLAIVVIGKVHGNAFIYFQF